MKRGVRGLWVWAAAVAAVLVATIGYLALVFVPGEREATIEYWQRVQENTAHNRAAALQLWVTQRLGEAEGVATLPAVHRLLSAPARASASEGEEVIAILTSLVSTQGARRAFIVDASLRVAARDAEPGELDPRCLDAARSVLASGVGAADFHKPDTGDVATTTFATPVRDTTAGAAPGSLLGVVVIVEDPRRWLYPYLARRPGPVRTGESILVRREGDNVLFLSPLSFDPAPPLTLRRPLAIPGLAAAEALGGREDFGEYRDYRGVAVFAALRRIPHTDWAIVSKIDQDEALAPFRARMWRDALMAGSLLLAVFSLTLLAWRTQSARHQADLARTAHRKQLFLQSILDGIPIVVTVKDGERYTLVNAAWERFSGVPRDQAIGKTAHDVFPVDVADRIRRQDVVTLDADAWNETEVTLSSGHGRRTYLTSRFPLRGGEGRIEGLVGLAVDITERKEVEERLREYERVVEGLEEMIVVVDRDYRYRLANRAYLDYRGITRDEVLGRLAPEVVGKEVFEREIKTNLDECLQGRVVNFEMRYDYPRLGARDLSISSLPIEGPGGVDRVAFVLRDITERKRAEEEQERLREAQQALARQLVSAQETERREIARELHDEAGQLLTGLKLLIESADLDACGEASPTSELKEDITSTVDELLTVIRDISTRLRPPMLDDLGLVPTLIWQVQRFAAHTGVRVRLDCDPSTTRRFGADVEVAAYRLVQESLTNVARHAMTDTAKVELRTDGTKLQVRVSDSGRGFSPSEKMHGPSLGLLGMHERCLALGGRLSIDSSPGAGTTVAAELPFEPGTGEARP